MANLRIVAVNAADSRTIKAKFTHSLSLSISAQNISIVGVNESTPDVTITSIDVRDDILVINTYPMTPYAKYTIRFSSIQGSPFCDTTGRIFLFDDGRTNVVGFIGPEDPDNTYRDSFIDSIEGTPYAPEQGTLSRLYINAATEALKKLKAGIRQTKNENYLSVTVKDEKKTRGYGPWDRLLEEGAYEISRVGLDKENRVLNGQKSYESFPFDIIPLQGIENQETLIAGTGAGTFSQLTLTTSKYPITKVSSIVVNYGNGDRYVYNILQYGYQLNSSRYDSLYASAYLLLGENQVALSDEVLNDPLFITPSGGDTITIEYEYKCLGISIDPESVVVYELNDSIREQTPPIVAQFSLQHFPVVTASGVTATSGGVTFLNPEGATPFRSVHPAFTIEIPFRLDAPPSSAGQYSVDYESGRVYVYGASTNDGTGDFPPAATYKYKFSYAPGLDYNYWPTENELAANSQRDLVSQSVIVSFNYEYDLIPGIDYIANPHCEAINERIGNRLTSSGSLVTANGIVTNVFRIFNETTGEIYKPTRFFNDTVYFSSNTPPSIKTSKYERATFQKQLNETIIVASSSLNGSGTLVYKANLLNENIIGTSEDCIGSSFNSGITFSRQDLFQTELYYDSILSVSQNTDRLTSGQYQVDYASGIVYLGLQPSFDGYSIGTISYNKPVVSPANPHVLSVSDIFTSVDPSFGVSKVLNYESFGDGEITPSVFDRSDERFTNGDISLPYFVDSGTITVTDDIKSIRKIYDGYDLNNNSDPIDFAIGATSSGNVITLSSVEAYGQYTVATGRVISINTHSPGISLDGVSSIVRLSDSQEMLDGYETITGNDITLSVSSGATAGDVVRVICTLAMNGGATPIVDYDRGEYYINYTYTSDEILVSYEYGDNVIDFRTSNSIEPGDDYYVTYKVGALRDSLLANFGSMIRIPELNTFSIDFERDRYRDALIGAMQTFLKGPTKTSMQELIKSVSKTNPEIIEAVFQVWSLGISRLGTDHFKLNGDPSFVSGKYDQGILFEQAGEAVTFPVSSNLRVEDGTLEMWVKPQWSGIDNDATLTFSDLQKDGYDLSASDIFIGSDSHNPSAIPFSITKAEAEGLPSEIYTSKGLFIYYDDGYAQWKFIAGDLNHTYSGNIVTDGDFYNVVQITNLIETNDTVRTKAKSIEFEFVLTEAAHDGYLSGSDGYVASTTFDGISFVSDKEHYLFDFGKEHDRNRFSLYKDGKGYLNFVVWDNGSKHFDKPGRKNKYQVSSDISSWAAGELHHVAISWRLNTSDRRDEMHIFVDGLEASNIIRFGGIPSATSSSIFRTVVPEIIAGTVPKTSVVDDDIVVVQGSDVVTSVSNNFSTYGIAPGDIIEINETGFSQYTILGVSGNSLQLDSLMPASLEDVKFSVNPYSVVVETEIDIYPNIAVSKYYNGVETELPGLRAVVPGYQITRNAYNERVLKVLGTVEAGSQIYIRTLGKNHRKCKEKIYLYGSQSILKTQLPPPINLDDVFIRAVPLPLVSIGPSNATIVGSDFTITLNPTQPTSLSEGRHLEVRITGGNVDFSTPTTVTINGTSDGGVSETLTFSSAGKQNSANKWMTITSVDVVTTPISLLSSGAGIEIKEQYSITESDGNTSFPVIRYSYQYQSGTNLEGDGYLTVSDGYGFFPQSSVGNLIQVTAPASAAGIYSIESVLSPTSIVLDGYAGSVAFTGGRYAIYDVSIARSGFQNGFFFIEEAGQSLTAYTIPEGYYEFDYAVYLEVSMDPVSGISATLGNSFDGLYPANAVIDEFRILSGMISDTRVGETVGVNEQSVTTDFLSIAAARKTRSTLVLLHLDEYPLINSCDYYTFANSQYIQSSNSVNSNFNESVVFTDKGLSFDNENRLDTSKEGTIEFWASPRFDTYNDPVVRYYFDAASVVVDKVSSLTRAVVKATGSIEMVVSVRLASDTSNTGVNFYPGGSIASDRKTITLGKPLPYQNVPVKIEYIPSGLSGDRISIYKDVDGMITFKVMAGGTAFTLSQPIFWARDSWHRVRASYKFNSADNRDELRLFVDGEEKGIVRFGQGLVFGSGLVFGQNASLASNTSLIANIDFTDSIQSFNIGQSYLGSNAAQSRIDNFRISNKALVPVVVGGQSIDTSYNVSLAYPVMENVYTTFLMDFDRLSYKADDFAVLRDPTFGIYNFTVKVIDSFGIVSGSQRVKDTLISMIEELKPATSKAIIEVVQ